MAEVVLDAPGGSGLAEMIADLVRANLAADPARERLIETRRGAAELVVRDAGVVVGLKLVPGALTVTDRPVPGADLRVVADADVLLALPSVPLVAGLPDPRAPAGRDLLGQLLRRRLRLRVRPSGLALLRALLRLLAVG